MRPVDAAGNAHAGTSYGAVVSLFEAGTTVRVLGGGARPMSPIFATSNRNKRGMVLDLKQEPGIEVLKKLVAGADVFVQNLAPGAAE